MERTLRCKAKSGPEPDGRRGGLLGDRHRFRGFGGRRHAMELREALTQITEIRLQLARTEVFRGYRAMPVAFSGAVALVAAVIQAVTITDPQAQIGGYLALWIG